MANEWSNSSQSIDTDEEEADELSTSSAETSEDEEIDVENGELDKAWVSKSYALPSTSNPHEQFDKTKKTHHNALERKRRIDIADTYACLKETLDVDLSRTQLLKYAAEKILEDEELVRQQDLAIADLKRQCDALLHEAESVKKAKTKS